MPITRLALTDFRSYADALIAPGPGFVVLTGENGAGKTNILEAVSLLAPGRGLRGASLGEMARSDGPGGFAVAAELFEPLPFKGGVGVGVSEASPIACASPTPSPSLGREGSQVSIGTGTLASAPERRQVRVNGAPGAATALAEWLSIVWLTPAMDRLFIEAPGGRRRFLDRLTLALQPGHASHAARYDAAMRARNRLLAQDGAPDSDWLTALEAQMAEHGAALAEARAEAVAEMNARIATQPGGPFARAGLALEGWEGVDLATALSAGRARDAAAGRTLEGPHRTDLIVTHLAKQQPAERCSTGEQKALLLGIVLAHADLVAERAGRRPILLLDEIAAHLDGARRDALFERLAADGGQVWMTGTERALFDAASNSAQHYSIAEGVISAI